MWHIREAMKEGNKLKFVPLDELPLPERQHPGIIPSGDISTDGKDAAVKSIELFAGAGGLALGTARAGLKHKVVIEWDDNAYSTLRRNCLDGVEHVRDWKIVQGDVRDYDFAKHRDEVAFVSGGPPCQPFNIGGKHRGEQDTRNMFPQAVRQEK